MADLEEQIIQQEDTWLNRNVLGMGITSFLSDAGHEMATSVLPAFLAAIGAPPVALGAIEGIADAVSSFVKLGAGWFSDRLGRRKNIVTLGYFLTGIAKAVFAFANTWLLVLFGRTVGWFGRGIRGPLRDAMLTDSVPSRFRGKAFGFHRAGDTLGAVVGPLIAVYVLQFLSNPVEPTAPFRTIFLLTLIPGIGSALVFFLMVREVPHEGNRELRLWSTIRTLPSDFKRFLTAVGLFGIGDFSHTLIILASTQLLATSLGPIKAAQMAATLYVVRNIFYTLASYPIGAISDRIGRGKLLAVGYLLGSIVSFGFAIEFSLNTSSILYLGFLSALAGVYIAAEDALEGALTGDYIDSKIRGTAFGVLGTINGIGDLFSSLAVGFLWTAVSPKFAFSYSAIVMLAGTLTLFWLLSTTKHNRQEA
ncbi:MAG: MFS transporter [Firmicutes bacterium]|nr:MFS transporter [Bacillota bacterium]